MDNQKRIEGLLNASPEKRYKSFLNIVTDLEEVWLLLSSDGYGTVEIEGNVYVLLWPQKEFCLQFLSDSKSAVSMEIHEFLDNCSTLDATIRFMIFPNDKDAYLVTTEQLVFDIQTHLDEIE